MRRSPSEHRLSERADKRCQRFFVRKRVDGRILLPLSVERPDFVPIAVAVRQSKGEQVAFAGQGPELARALETILQLSTGGFDRSGAFWALLRLHGFVMQMFAVRLKIIGLALDDPPGLVAQFFAALAQSLQLC